MAYKSPFAGSRLLAVTYLIIMTIIFFIGYRLRPVLVDLPQKLPQQFHYDTQGAILKVAADLTMRRIRLQEGDSRIFKIDNQAVLVKRESAAAKPATVPMAVYLLEGARPDAESDEGFRRWQFALIDLEPEAAFGKMQVGFWRNRAQRR